MRCASCRTENPDAMKFCGNCGTPLRAEPAEAHAELRQLTVLFCDLVGSTALSESLEPEDLREVMASYHEACAEVIRRQHGHIAQYLGDGVLVYFGYPRAQEDAARRAVRAGLEIVAAIATLSVKLQATRGIDLAVRIGVHTGPVVVGDVGGGERREQLAQGKTPNVAARIQTIATPGTVVVGDATHRIVQGFFEFTSLGEQGMKGLSDVMVLYRAERESGAETRLDVARRAGLTRLTGREGELASLVDRWEAVRKSGGHAVLIRGEAGIGKSRMADTLRARAGREGAIVVESYCTPYSRQTALFPIAGMLERSLGFRRDTTVTDKRSALEARLRQRGVHADESLALMSQLLGIALDGADPTSSYSPQKRRVRTLEILRDWLFATARDGAVLWVVEDLHWADPTTIEFVSFVLREFADTPALVVLTSRPEFEAPWLSGERASLIALHRLAPSDTGAMVSSVARGKSIPAEVLSQIVARTEGVPLFVEEVTKAVLELDVLTEFEDRYELAGPLPPDLIPSTVQDSLNARLDRLGSAKATAQLAATIGREFRFDLLRAVAGDGATGLRDDLLRLVLSELVYPSEDATEETYLFKHALIQDAAYQSLLKKSRRDLHERIADVLLARFPDVAQSRPELVAEHFTAAGRIQQAVTQWGLAGQLALGRAAYHEAASHLRHGLGLVGELPEEVREAREIEFQLGLIPALISTQGWASAELNTVYIRARALVEREAGSPYEFLVLSGTLGYHLTGGRINRALVLCEEVLTLAQKRGDPMSLAMAHQNFSATACWHGDWQAAIHHAERGLALFDTEVERAITSMVGLSSFVALPCYRTAAEWMLGQLGRVIPSSDEALASAHRHGHPHSIGCALGYRCQAFMLMGDARGVLAVTDENIRYARDQRLEFWVAPARIYRGWALCNLGRVAEGLSEIREAFAFFLAGGNGVSGVLFRAVLAEALWAAGERSEAFATLDEGTAHATTNDEWLFAPELFRLRAEWLMVEADVARGTSRSHDKAGRLAGAENSAREAVALARRQGAVPLELRALTTLVRVRRAQGHGAAAELSELATCHARFPSGFSMPELAAARALLSP